MTMIEAVEKYTGKDFSKVETVEEARKIADELHVEYGEYDGIGKIINACFEDYVEENLIQPTVITGHPWKFRPYETRCVQSFVDPSIRSLYLWPRTG